MLILKTGMLGAFLAIDLFLFYVMWEVMLVPMYFIIGIWGGDRRLYASIKFVIYTMVGSLLMLVAIVYLCTLRPRRRPVVSFDYDTCQRASIASTEARAGSSPPSRSRSPSRCRCSRCTPGCPTRTSRRRPPAR